MVLGTRGRAMMKTDQSPCFDSAYLLLESRLHKTNRYIVVFFSFTNTQVSRTVGYWKGMMLQRKIGRETEGRALKGR